LVSMVRASTGGPNLADKRSRFTDEATRYSRDGRFTALHRHTILAAVLAAGSVTGTILGGPFAGRPT
jgi:hypothetical protein